MRNRPRRLEVILKVSEVCNIACTYCYYFFSGDDRASGRPARIGQEVIEGLVRFANAAFDSGEIDFLQIDLHGGEPMMTGVRHMESVCEALRAIRGPYRLCMTTNAMLVTEDWIALLERFDIAVCVSVDGDARTHDRRRLDKQGNGTYGRVIAGIDRLKAAQAQDRIKQISALVVVDPKADAVRTYDHVVHHLGLKHLDFLMPDVTHETTDSQPAAVAAYMSALMSRWLADDDPTINLRILRSVLTLLASGRTHLAGFGGGLPFALTVGSDGQIDSDDFLKPCGAEMISTPLSIMNATLAEVLAHHSFDALSEELSVLPGPCAACEVAGACRGGQATHRFSKDRRFDNPSVYCQAHRQMFHLGARHLLHTGLPAERLERHLVYG